MEKTEFSEIQSSNDMIIFKKVTLVLIIDCRAQYLNTIANSYFPEGGTFLKLIDIHYKNITNLQILDSINSNTTIGVKIIDSLSISKLNNEENQSKVFTNFTLNLNC